MAVCMMAGRANDYEYVLVAVKVYSTIVMDPLNVLWLLMIRMLIRRMM